MTYWLVSARPRTERLRELRERLQTRAFIKLRPFGQSLTTGLIGARLRNDGTVVWEEEDYCDPPLAQERAAVLDDYFTTIEVEAVEEGEGWRRILELPKVFPNLKGDDEEN